LNFSPDVIKGDKVKKLEIRGTCGTHWREDFGGKKRNLKDINYMEDNTKIERMEIRREGADGIYLAQIMTAGGLL
jgi:hypothetical protein